MLSSALRANARRSLASFPHPLTTSDAQRNTIYALSTPQGKGGVAVVRVSGPDALAVWKHLVRPSRPRSDVQPWRMEYCRIVRPFSDSEETLDNGLAVFFKGACAIFIPGIPSPDCSFPGPKSFTTDDVVELHVHSGRAVIAAILSALSSIPFCRPAEPGEFTRRAFLGGRLDLTQVEGLKDLIDAETESQRQMAIQATGVGNFMP
jgi:tRNA modification GTPase